MSTRAQESGMISTLKKLLGDHSRDVEDRYQYLAQDQGELICCFNPDGSLKFVNDAYCRYFSVRREDSIGHLYNGMLSPADAKRVRAHVDALTPGHPVACIEHRVIMPSGAIRWLRWSDRALFSADGHVTEYISVGRDITDVKSGEEALRACEEREARYRDALRISGIGLWTWDIGAETAEWSDQCVEIAGMVPGGPALRYDELPLIFTPESWGWMEEAIHRTQDTGIPYELELDLIRRDGTHRRVLSHGEAVRDGIGRVIRLQGTFQDITGKKEVEVALRRSEERYRILSEISPDAIMLHHEGVICYANPEAGHILGAGSPDELLGKKILDFVHPDYQGEIIRMIQRDLAGESTPFMEAPMVRLDGSLVFTEGKGVMTDFDGQPAILVAIRDITDRKEAEDALRESQERYRTVIEDQNEFVCRFSPDGRLTFVNDAYCRYFGLKREDCIGKRHSVYLQPADRLLMKQHLGALTPQSPVAEISHCTRLPSGEMRWQHWSDRAIYGHSGQIIEYQSVGRDITQEKRIEEELFLSRENLEEQVNARTLALILANKQLSTEIDRRKEIEKELIISGNQKDLLLRELHHRVKNNLQLVVGLIDMTITRTHDQAVAMALTDIMTKVQTMGLVHTRLYESKRFDRINMNRFIQDLVDTLSTLYSHDHRTITTRIAVADVHLPVDMATPCALALNEVFSNIFKHAFKGRREGIMEVSAWMEGEVLRFEIRDNGIGLPSGFDIEKSNRLGLKLVRTLVQQQLHGSMKISGRKGTEVVIEIPLP